jgi:hypothetical protein
VHITQAQQLVDRATSFVKEEKYGVACEYFFHAAELLLLAARYSRDVGTVKSLKVLALSHAEKAALLRKRAEALKERAERSASEAERERCALLQYHVPICHRP